MDPKDELNSLLNDVIGMAVRLVEKHGSHIPFCMAVTATGERVNIAADDSALPGADQLLAGIREHITEALRERRYRAVALARNVEYRWAKDGSRTDAVQITLDHEQGSPVTCYLPYQLAHGRVVPGELFAVDPQERFFTAGDADEPERLLTKQQLAGVLVGMNRDGFVHCLRDLTSLCHPDEFPLVERMSAIMGELLKTFDYAKSPEFLRSILGKSAAFIEMKKRLLTPVKRTENFKRLCDALANVGKSDAAFDLIEESRQGRIKELRDLLSEISNSDDPS
jgi:hypothetical protein